MKNYYYINAGMMLARSPEWEADKYGFYPDGIGDCIGRSAKAALVYHKPEMLQKCVDLLKIGKRWPDELEGVNCAKNWFDYTWSRLRYKLGISTWYRKYRHQTSITRDPIIGVICALWVMDWFTFRMSLNNWGKQIKDIKIRWWQNRPDLYHWKKYLETGKAKHKRKYEWWAKIGLSKRTPVYVLNHMAWMAYVAESDRMKEKLWSHIPHWNYLLRELTNHPLNHLHRILIENYQAKSGSQWSHHTLIKPPEDSHFYLDPDDEFKMDLDELNYILKLVTS